MNYNHENLCLNFHIIHVRRLNIYLVLSFFVSAENLIIETNVGRHEFCRHGNQYHCRY